MKNNTLPITTNSTGSGTVLASLRGSIANHRYRGKIRQAGLTTGAGNVKQPQCSILFKYMYINNYEKLTFWRSGW